MRAQRLRAAALAGAVLVSCGLDADDLLEPAAPVAPSAEGASVSGPTGGELARPRVAAEDPARSRYDRDQWQPHGWEDADRDGCNTREEVLLSEGRDVVTGPGCRILSGAWTDLFTGREVTSPSRLEVDHLVALGDAHRSAGWAWPAERKVAFANDLEDPDALNAVGGAVNQAKADYGPDRWLPQPGSTARCWYVAAYARIKARWDLTVTPQQWAAIERVWAGCGTIGS